MITRMVERLLDRLTLRPIAPYQAAVVRIGFALTFAVFLLREWPHRRELYGPGAAWSGDLARQMLVQNHSFTVLVWSDSPAWFEFVYAAAIVVSALLLVGWRTRAMSVLFLVLVLSVQNRAVLVGDGGDNVIHLMALYLPFTRCAEVWSLDARRHGRPSDGSGPALWLALGLALATVQVTGFAKLGMLDFGWYSWGTFFWLYWAALGLWWFVSNRFPAGQWHRLADGLANLTHAAAMLVVAAEVCLIYATAGWYKIQGSLWQGGTAVWFPLHIQYFEPWPGLAGLLSGSAVLLTLVTYGTVIMQVGFPFLVFNRRVKNVLLVLMVAEHVGIAVALGLPIFSLAMIAADAVFLPTTFLQRAARGGGAVGHRLATRVRHSNARSLLAPERPEQAVSEG